MEGTATRETLKTVQVSHNATVSLVVVTHGQDSEIHVVPSPNPDETIIFPIEKMDYVMEWMSELETLGSRMDKLVVKCACGTATPADKAYINNVRVAGNGMGTTSGDLFQILRSTYTHGIS